MPTAWPRSTSSPTPHWSSRMIRKPAYTVLHQGLGTEAEGKTSDAGTGEQGPEVEVEHPEHYEEGDRPDHRRHRRPADNRKGVGAGSLASVGGRGVGGLAADAFQCSGCQPGANGEPTDRRRDGSAHPPVDQPGDYENEEGHQGAGHHPVRPTRQESIVGEVPRRLAEPRGGLVTRFDQFLVDLGDQGQHQGEAHRRYFSGTSRSDPMPSPALLVPSSPAVTRSPTLHHPLTQFSPFSHPPT